MSSNLVNSELSNSTGESVPRWDTVRNGAGLQYLRSLKERVGEEYSLAPLLSVLEPLQNPHTKIRAIHIAGTNGKGSVAVTVASILGAAGHSVGLYTSPHLSRMNERIVLNGASISDDLLNQAALRVAAASDGVGVELSFFEAITAIAFLVFSESSLDYVVLEAGLGGRLDATNVISKPVLSVITSIGLDHQDILGTTIEQIAAEKAGIFRAGVPAVVGLIPPQALAVMREKAREVGALLFCYGEAFETDDTLHPRLLGDHQLLNAAVAYFSTRLLGVSEMQAREAIQHVTWPGRLEWIDTRSRRFLLDSAHNLDGFASLTTYLKAQSIAPVEIGFGALSTKDWKEMITALIPFVHAWNLITPDSPKAVQDEEVAAFLSGSGISSTCFGGGYQQFVDRLSSDASSRPILVTGSIYLVGGVRQCIVKGDNLLWKQCKSL